MTGMKRRWRCDLAFDAAPVVVAERHQTAEIVERVADVVGLLGDQQGAPVEPVAGEHLAEPVEHPPARRRHRRALIRFSSASVA